MNNMTASEILKQLEEYGSEQTKKTLIKHGAREPFFGVKVADLKKILKKTKKNHELSLELYKTGNSDAMYLAGLMADEKKISEAQLNEWVEQAYWYYLSEYAVAWVAAETDFGFKLAQKWIESESEQIASAGWGTLAIIARVRKDEELDIEAFSKLLDRVEKSIHSGQNRVRYTMNGFVISVGTFIKDLTEKSLSVAENIGKVDVFVGDTSCKVPMATEYIHKVIKMDKIGQKRKSTRC